MGASCPFCDIIAGDAPGRVLRTWDDGAIAFVPLNPVVEGHLLVVPRQHVIDALEDPAVTAAVMSHAAELAGRPCNIITSAGAEATQSVFHLHVHIVPRAFGDGLRLPWPEHNANPCRGRCEFHGKLWCNETGRPCWEFMDQLESRSGGEVTDGT